MRGREERSEKQCKQFEGLSSCESSGVSQLGFGSKIAQQNSEVWAKLSSHSTIPGSSRAALLPAASSRETCACPSLRSDLRALVTSTSLWCAARGGRVGLRCFSHSGVITNKHWHKLHG